MGKLLSDVHDRERPGAGDTWATCKRWLHPWDSKLVHVKWGKGIYSMICESVGFPTQCVGSASRAAVLKSCNIGMGC
jgi:hypothetical protein